MERRKEDRSLLIFILLTAVTCGIYGIIFWWNLCKDLNVVCGVKEPDDEYKSPNYIVVCLLGLITCGIYMFFWIYKQGNRMQRAGNAYGVQIDENGTTYLLWILFGSLLCGAGPLVAYHLMFKNLNKLCVCYNREYADIGFGGGSANGGAYPQTPAGSGSGDIVSSGRIADNVKSITKEKELLEDKYLNGSDPTSKGVTIGLRAGTLKCTKGSLAGAEIPLTDREMIMIGRDGAACNLVLPDQDISRRHCTVQYNASEGCYFVTDYSSLGVKLDGCPLIKSEITKCPRGSRILLGDGNNEFILE